MWAQRGRSHTNTTTHNHTQRQMSAQLPIEIVDHIVGYLDFEDIRSIARVCSAFRLPAQRRLFRTIKIVPGPPGRSKAYPCHIKSILSSPHLLQYSSGLMVHCSNSIQQISIQSLWTHLPVMYRLSTMYLYLEPSACSRVLSILESLGSAREIALYFRYGLAPDLSISDNPLPTRTLELYVNASNHQVVTRLLQKCSQSLRKLTLYLRDNTIPSLPFLPHLYEFSVHSHRHDIGNEPDLMSLFPFLDQHPTITRLSLGYQFTLAVQPPPNLLPDLQFLDADPVIIERLIPGRGVYDIHAGYYSPRFPVDILLQPLRHPFVPVTTFAIDANVHLPNNYLISIVQALPKLRKFTLTWTCYEVRQSLEGRKHPELTGNRPLSP